MVYQNHKFLVLSGAISLVLVAIKLFTVEIWFKDDPSTMLAIRFSPSFKSLITVDDVDRRNYHTLFIDENGFVGESLYHLITQYLWWMLPLLCIIYIGIKLLNKNV